jgi:hypothetical protein
VLEAFQLADAAAVGKGRVSPNGTELHTSDGGAPSTHPATWAVGAPI